MIWRCMECWRKFATVKAAERASFGPNGCPKCGGADIDLVDENEPRPPHAGGKS